MKWLHGAALLFAILISYYVMSSNTGTFKRPDDILQLQTSVKPQYISYGALEEQFGLLRLPNASDQKAPLAIIIHGGCWNSKYADTSLMEPFAEGLTKLGFATWNIEYRSSDNGGGWPGTFLDIAAAVDYARTLAEKHPIDLEKVVVIGHSSGGHLALWAAARHKLSDNSEIYTSNPLKLAAAVNLGGPGDLKEFRPMQRNACRFDAVDAIFHDKVNNAELWDQASPSAMLPLNVKQLNATGEFDSAVTPELIQKYTQKAIAEGDDIQELIIPNTGHFDYLDPATSSFEIVKNEILTLLK